MFDLSTFGSQPKLSEEDGGKKSSYGGTMWRSLSMSGIPLPNKSNSGPGGRRLKSRGNGGVESLMNVLEGSLMGAVSKSGR